VRDSCYDRLAVSSSIHHSFDPAFDNRTRSARELLRQVQASRFKKANPKLKIAIDVHSRPDAPVAVFHFVDGTEVSEVSFVVTGSQRS
jgi:hypothetical protein